MKKTILFLAVAGLVGACSGTEKIDENLTIRPTAPTGSVGGVVYNASTDTPIPTDVVVNVSVIAGGTQPFQTTVNENGRFFVEGVSASGNVLVIVEAEGYLTAELTGTFINSAGEFPVNNAILSFGPIGLVPANQTLTIRLITENGTPVAGEAVTLRTMVRYLLYSDLGVTAHSNVSLSATTDADGKAQFTGLPDYPMLGERVDDLLFLTIPPISLAGNETYDYPGGTHLIYFMDAGGPQRTIVLTSNFDATLEVDASNVQGLEGQTNYMPTTMDPSEPINVLFNLPVDSDTLVVRAVRVARESGNWVEHTAETNVAVDGQFITIGFPTPLDEGAKYNLSIHAISTVGDKIVEGNFYAPFFTGYAAAPPAVEVVDVERDPDQGGGNTADILVHFNTPVGTGNAGWNNLNTANCVLWFNTPLDDPLPSGAGPGNSPGEWGYTSCNLGAAFGLVAEEKLPAMVGTYASGFSDVWRFSPPLAAGGNPMPAGVAFYITFSRITNANYLVTTPDGRIVTDQMDQTTP